VVSTYYLFNAKFLLYCPAFFPKADNTKPLYCPPFYFIVRLFTLIVRLSLYRLTFYFIVRLFTLPPFAQLMSNICIFFLVSGIFVKKIRPNYLHPKFGI
jgi:hypothetical protein